MKGSLCGPDFHRQTTSGLPAHNLPPRRSYSPSMPLPSLPLSLKTVSDCPCFVSVLINVEGWIQAGTRTHTKAPKLNARRVGLPCPVPIHYPPLPQILDAQGAPHRSTIVHESRVLETRGKLISNAGEPARFPLFRCVSLSLRCARVPYCAIRFT